jgi:hypothetical protein
MDRRCNLLLLVLSWLVMTPLADAYGAYSVHGFLLSLFFPL